MSYGIAKSVIAGYFQDHFLVDSAEPIPVEYPNRNLEDNDKTTDRTWGRLTILHAMEMSSEVGTQRSRIPGLVQFDIFIPEDTGMKDAYAIGDLIKVFMKDAYLGTDDGVIRFRTVSVRELPASGGWARLAVDMPFQRDVLDVAAPPAFVPYAP